MKVLLFMAMMSTAFGTDHSQEPKSFQDAELSFLALIMERAGIGMRSEFSEEEEGNYYLAAGKYFQASWGELQDIQAAGIDMVEIPVVLHIARHAAVGSGDVIRERIAGNGWLKVLARFCVQAETFYVPLMTGIGQAPTRPYRFYRDTARDAWKRREFDDKDVIRLANLKFAAEYYRIQPDKLVALLASGWTIASIHGELQSKELVWDTPGSGSKFRRAG